MNGKRMQIIFFALVAALIIGQGLLGGVRAPTLQEFFSGSSR